MTREERSLAERIALAFRELGFFLFQSELDRVEDVADVLRRARVSHIVSMSRIDARNSLYIVEVLDRGCRRKCSYEGGCGNDKKCLSDCVEQCTSELRKRVTEALERVARQLH